VLGSRMSEPWSCNTVGGLGLPVFDWMRQRHKHLVWEKYGCSDLRMGLFNEQLCDDGFFFFFLCLCGRSSIV
jgi:hypothetical protein